MKTSTTQFRQCKQTKDKTEDEQKVLLKNVTFKKSGESKINLVFEENREEKIL